MRVADSGFDGVPAEDSVEVSRGLLVGQLREFGPKMDLVAGTLAAKALVDVAPHIDRECFLSLAVGSVAG